LVSALALVRVFSRRLSFGIRRLRGKEGPKPTFDEESELFRHLAGHALGTIGLVLVIFLLMDWIS
jgi:hypothetical protein